MPILEVDAGRYELHKLVGAGRKGPELDSSSTDHRNIGERAAETAQGAIPEFKGGQAMHCSWPNFVSRGGTPSISSMRRHMAALLLRIRISGRPGGLVNVDNFPICLR